MIEMAKQNNDWGFKNTEFRKIAQARRLLGFSRGEKSGLYIDGRKSKPGYGAAIECKRRLKKFNQTPLNADFKKIELFYEIAKRLTILTGQQYDVDHIVPISKGGLHHENNLRIMTHIENIKKSNKIIDKYGIENAARSSV